MKLRDKVAIITGAGRGLGRSSALAMAREGASVVILSRTPSELAETAGVIESEGGNVLALRADVSVASDIEAVVDETISVLGRIDILMNNAAEIGPVQLLTEIDQEEWSIVMDINLKGVYLCCQAVVPHMSRQKGGKIINITSGLAEIVMPPLGAYSVSKAGVNHLTRIMAEELRAYNIQVNALDPGIMDTSMQEELRDMGPEILGEALFNQFQTFKEEGHLRSPDDIAKLAVFLASDSSDEITGEIGSELDFMGYGYGVDSTDN
ncbi:SDR family oxidoreductase [bacterium]|nr:MAG: SDR family oxidoreductase [bacterium]